MIERSWTMDRIGLAFNGFAQRRCAGGNRET
jgi:hypothetical protein